MKFRGGLGNQLFQYALARAMVGKRGYIISDISSYKNDYVGRNYRINEFNIKIDEKLSGLIFKSLFKIKPFIDLLKKLGLFACVNEFDFQVDYEISKKIKILTSLDGYWQSSLYFENIRSLLLKEYVPKKMPEIPHLFYQKNTVAIHVRRGDYLDQPQHGVLNYQYFYDAIDFIKSRLSSVVLVLFSDDIIWCKSKFNLSDITFIDSTYCKEDYIQLYLMSICKHQIISNSSFSWWAAWLNQNINKIIVRPRNPFRDHALYYENYYPESWISIDNKFL